MSTPAVADDKQAEAPGLLFAWSRKSDSAMPMLFAWIITGACFAFVLHSLRIDLGSAPSTRVERASLLIAGNDAVGIELKRRAREEGPLPLRFDPTGDAALARIEEVALDALRWTPSPYVPTLRPLPDSAPLASPRLAAAGETVLPSRALPVTESLAAPESRPRPVLSPLSGITAGEMPRELPDFVGTIDAKSARDLWRFMIHADASGRVIDCIALNGGESPATAALADWLRQVEFQPVSGSADRWFVLDLGIINQAAHAPDPH